MAKYKRVSRRIINQKAGTIAVARLGLDCATDAEMKHFDKEPVKIPEETGPTLQQQRDIDEGVRNGGGDGPELGPRVSKNKFNGKKKKSRLTKVGVGLGVMVHVSLLVFLIVVYHYDEFTVTYNSYF